MPQTQKHLDVWLQPSRDEVLLKSPAGDIRVATSHPEKSVMGLERADYAAWYLIPISMRLGRPLFIHGTGSPETAANFKKLTRMWQTWLPGHFSATTVRFSKLMPREASSEIHNRSLLYYSGGLDATYTGLMRLKSGMTQDLLTVHGMDYNNADPSAFEALLAKTQAFANCLANTRIVVKSDAYDLYSKYEVNLSNRHLAHVFSLAGAGFFHATEYQNLVLAADERIDGQFLTFPWGTNSISNPLFDDGKTKILTHGDDVTRAEKLLAAHESSQAMQSLSFCWNRSLQPLNCGTCRKCLRTKMLCLAATGKVPEIFLNRSVPANWLKKLRYQRSADLLSVQEILTAAESYDNVAAIPDWSAAQETVRNHYRRRHSWARIWKNRHRLKTIWKHWRIKS